MNVRQRKERYSIVVRESPACTFFAGLQMSLIDRDLACANIFSILEKIASGDHFIPLEVAWEDFLYYRNRLNGIIDAS